MEKRIFYEKHDTTYATLHMIMWPCMVLHQSDRKSSASWITLVLQKSHTDRASCWFRSPPLQIGLKKYFPLEWVINRLMEWEHTFCSDENNSADATDPLITPLTAGTTSDALKLARCPIHMCIFSWWDWLHNLLWEKVVWLRKKNRAGVGNPADSWQLQLQRDDMSQCSSWKMEC